VMSLAACDSVRTRTGSSKLELVRFLGWSPPTLFRNASSTRHRGPLVSCRSRLFVGEAGSERVKVGALKGTPAPRNGGGGGGDNINFTLHVNGGLGSFTRQHLKHLVKSAYLEIASRGIFVRRLTADQARRAQ